MNRDKITILLNLNVIDMYNHVSKERLIHNLRRRRTFDWIIVWINNFIQDKHTTLKIKKQSTLMNLIKIDISQIFFVSLILYFFYNVNILKVFERFRYKITIINFVNASTFWRITQASQTTVKHWKKRTSSTSCEHADTKLDWS
jgi:hypothetical protein